MRSVENNAEPPKRLRKPTTIYLGAYGNIQIGHLPELDEEEAEPYFLLKVVIVLGNTWIMLNPLEIANLFIYIRQLEPFSDMDGEYQEFVTREFKGQFSAEFTLSKWKITFIDNIESPQHEYSIEFPSERMVVELLLLEKIVNGHLYKKTAVSRDLECELLETLQNAVMECTDSPLHLKFLATQSPNSLIVELATNQFSFFTQYWYTQNDQALKRLFQ